MLRLVYFSLIQGLSEFLPISSSGHLFIFQNSFAPRENFLPFFVFLHIATLAAVCVFFYKEIYLFLKNKKVIIFLVIATIITGLFGVFADWFLGRYFTKNNFIFVFLFINGLILLTARKFKGSREVGDISIKDALFLGVLQGVSFLPGISRSGITIIGFLARGFKAKTAFLLSFLMSIFPIAGTFLFKITDLAKIQLNPFLLFLSFLITFMAGLFSLFLVKKSLTGKKFIYFGYYCIIVSTVGLLIY